MVQKVEAIEIDIDGRCVPSVPVGVDSGGVVAKGLAVSLDKLLEWAVRLFSENVELSLEL